MRVSGHSQRDRANQPRQRQRKPLREREKAVAGWCAVLAVVSALACADDAPPLSAVDSAACETCSITLEPVAVLGSREDTIWPTQYSTLTQTRSGNFIMGALDHPVTHGIYDGAGTLLRTFGRYGMGPGEYSSPMTRWMRGPGDSVGVVDQMSGRWTLVDDSGGVVRTQELTSSTFHQMVWLGDGRRVMVADIQSPDLVGKPLHVLDEDAKIVTSFGETGNYSNELDGWRFIAPSSAGGVWVALYNRYRIEHYDADLTVTRVLEFEPDWFLPWDHTPMPGEQFPPAMAGLWEDDGLLWVLVSTPDRRWDPAAANIRPETRRERDLTFERDAVFEVIELESGSVVAHQRFDEYVLKIEGVDLLYSKAKRPVVGGYEVTVFSPTLHRR
ncbi:MAG: hypothetical protein WEA24_09585 [Gemmatimonadota bacterium]